MVLSRTKKSMKLFFFFCVIFLGFSFVKTFQYSFFHGYKFFSKKKGEKLAVVKSWYKFFLMFLMRMLSGFEEKQKVIITKKKKKNLC